MVGGTGTGSGMDGIVSDTKVDDFTINRTFLIPPLFLLLLFSLSHHEIDASNLS